jgi:hypothetical protein
MQARIVREGMTPPPLPADAPVANSSAIILGLLQPKHTRQSIASCHSKPEHWSEASPKDALACGLQLPVTPRQRGEKHLYGYLQQTHSRSFPAPLHNLNLLPRQPVQLQHSPFPFKPAAFQTCGISLQSAI